MNISSEDQSYLIERIPGVKVLLDMGDVGGILDAIDLWYLAGNGFAPPDYEDYNAEGVKMQNVRDRIYWDTAPEN